MRAERVIALLPLVCFVLRHSILATIMHHVLLQMASLSIQTVVHVEQVIVRRQMDCIATLQSTNVPKIVGVITKMARLRIQMFVLVGGASVIQHQDFFVNFPLDNAPRLRTKGCRNFVTFNPQPVATASGAKWRR